MRGIGFPRPCLFLMHVFTASQPFSWLCMTVVIDGNKVVSAAFHACLLIRGLFDFRFLGARSFGLLDACATSAFFSLVFLNFNGFRRHCLSLEYIHEILIGAIPIARIFVLSARSLSPAFSIGAIPVSPGYASIVSAILSPALSFCQRDPCRLHFHFVSAILVSPGYLVFVISAISIAWIFRQRDPVSPE
jgi:hypothetical protein